MQILTMVKKGACSIVLAIGIADTIGITYFYLLATTANKWHCNASSVYGITPPMAFHVVQLLHG